MSGTAEAGTETNDRIRFLTSFILIAKRQPCSTRIHDNSMESSPRILSTATHSKQWRIDFPSRYTVQTSHSRSVRITMLDMCEYSAIHQMSPNIVWIGGNGRPIRSNRELFKLVRHRCSHNSKGLLNGWEVRWCSDLNNHASEPCA